MLRSFVLLYKMQRFFYDGHSLKRTAFSYLNEKSSVKAQSETTWVEAGDKMCHGINVTLKTIFYKNIKLHMRAEGCNQRFLSVL